MEIKIEDILEYTLPGKKVETKEQFVEEFTKLYYTEDQIFKDKPTKDKFFGRTIGSIATGVKQAFDSFGVELTGDDLNQPPEAITKLGIQRLADLHQEKITELEKTAGLSADEKLKELNDTLLKSQSKIKDLEKLAKDRAVDLENEKKNSKTLITNFQIEGERKEAESAIVWNPEKDQFSRKGFLAEMNEKYIIDLDESGKKFIASRATGERIKAEGSHSTFMTAPEVYKQDAIKAGMMGVNKKAGEKPITQQNETVKRPEGAAPQPLFKRVMANTSFKVDD